MKKRKIPQIRNKKLRMFFSCLCVLVLITYMTGVVLGFIGGHKYNLCLMKIGLGMSIISAIIMGMLHILYFRTPQFIKDKRFE